MKANNLDEVVVGFESTGSYGEPLVHYLRERGAKVVQVNPMHTKRIKELVGNSPSKTDNKDPKVIADIISLGHALTVVIPEGVVAEIRRLIHARERAMQRRTALLCQLQDILFPVFPEFFHLIKNVTTKTARYLLEHCPTPQSIVEKGLEDLTDTLRKISRGKLNQKSIQELYDAASNSIGIKAGVKSILFESKEIQASIRSCESFIEETEKEISIALKQIPYSSYLLSIKGMGEITVAGIIGEFGDLNNFRTVAEAEKLAGLNLYEISSGKQKGKLRISKRGRPLLRKLLYFAAINVVRKGGIFHDWYRKSRERGMPGMKALVAVSRKLLRLIFALVRNHSNYVEDYMNQKAVKMAA